MDLHYILTNRTLFSQSIEDKVIRWCSSNSNSRYLILVSLLILIMQIHSLHTKAKIVSHQCQSSQFSVILPSLMGTGSNKWVTLYLLYLWVWLKTKTRPTHSSFNQTWKIFFSSSNKCNNSSLLFRSFLICLKINQMYNNHKLVYFRISCDNLILSSRFTKIYCNKESNSSISQLYNRHLNSSESNNHIKSNKSMYCLRIAKISQMEFRMVITIKIWCMVT